MLSYLIKHFSTEGETVLDMMQLKGKIFTCIRTYLIPKLNYIHTYIYINEKHLNECYLFYFTVF